MKNIRQAFIKYVSLNIAGMLGLSCYILADTFFVARGVGAEGLTALNLAIPIFSLISGTGLMIGMGGATRFSLSKSKTVFTQALYFAAFAAVIFMICSAFSDTLAILLGADETTLSDTSVYLKTILMFSPAFLTNNCIICFVRNDGDPRRSMTAMLSGSFSNIILDYILIFPCKMGMFGAALATGIAPIVSLSILSYHFINKKNTFHILRSKPVINALLDIASLGAASFINEISSGIVIIAFNISILHISGNTGVAAYGIIANIALVVVSVFTGIAQGIQPVASNCSRISDREGLEKVLKYGIITSVLIAVIIYIVSVLSSDLIIGVFNRDNDTVLAQTAKNGLIIYFTSFVFSGINIVCAAFFSAVDKPRNAFLVSFMRGFAIVIPTVIILSALFGMNGIWLSMTLSELIVTIAVAIMFIRKK